MLGDSNEERLSGLKPPPQRGSSWKPQSKQASWAKAESRKEASLEARVFCAFFPFEDELLPLPLLVWGNSPGIQITAANAERAQWKALCERMKRLIHLKTWQILWNNPLEQVWLIGRDAGILHSMFDVPGRCALFHQTTTSRQPGSWGRPFTLRSFLCFCCHSRSCSKVMVLLLLEFVAISVK